MCEPGGIRSDLPSTLRSITSYLHSVLLPWRAFHAWRRRAALLLILTTITPSRPKIKTPERNESTSSSINFDNVNDTDSVINSVQRDIDRGKSSAQTAITRRPCLRERGSSPL